MPDPRRDHRDGHPLEVHQRRAGVSGGMQLDVPNPGRLHRVAPVAGQHRGRVRVADLVAHDVGPGAVAPRRGQAVRRPGGPSRPSAPTPADRATAGSAATSPTSGRSPLGRPPADTRLFTIDNVLPSRSTSDPPKSGDLAAPESRQSQLPSMTEPVVADRGQRVPVLRPRCRCRVPLCGTATRFDHTRRRCAPTRPCCLASANTCSTVAMTLLTECADHGRRFRPFRRLGTPGSQISHQRVDVSLGEPLDRQLAVPLQERTEVILQFRQRRGTQLVPPRQNSRHTTGRSSASCGQRTGLWRQRRRSRRARRGPPARSRTAAAPVAAAGLRIDSAVDRNLIAHNLFTCRAIGHDDLLDLRRKLLPTHSAAYPMIALSSRPMSSSSSATRVMAGAKASSFPSSPSTVAAARALGDRDA